MDLIEIVPVHSLEHKREIRRMAADVMPKDKTWHVALLIAAVAFLDALAVVRWWLCV